MQKGWKLMKTRALKIVVAAMLVMSMLITAVGAATITKTKFNSGTGLLTVEYYVSGDEAVITAYDPLDESNVVYFYQQPGSGTGTFQFTVPETYTGETVAVKVGGTNEASATAFVSVTPTPAPTPDPESAEMGGIYNYIAKEPFAEDTVVVDKENKIIKMDSDFDIEVSSAVWKGIETSDDAFNFDSGYMYVDPVQKISREQITIKFAPITEGTTKISFDATMIANGKTWESPSYFGAVVDSETHAEASVSGKNQITGLATGMARVLQFNGRTILDNTSTAGIVRFDNTMNDSGKYTSYDLVVNDNVKHNYEYIIDMTNKTYSLSVDGNKIGDYDFYDSGVEKIDALKFYGSSYADSYHQNSRYSVDNIVVKTTQNIQTNNIKFYNETGTKLIKELNAHLNKQIAPPTAPTKRDSTFVGWSLTSGGNDLVSFDSVTEDMVVYAAYMTRPIITYMDGEEVYNTQAVEYGETITAPTLEDKGDYKFIGWYTADGNQASFAEITADMTVYSKFGIPNVSIWEEFDNGFTIDNGANTITTDSGLEVKADVAFHAIKPSVTDGALTVYGYNNYVASSTVKNGTMTFKFPEISSGKVYLDFDLKLITPGFSNWMAVWGTPTFKIGNSVTGGSAADLYFRGTASQGQNENVYLARNNASAATTNGVIGTIGTGAAAQTISYVIDMDAKSYSVKWNGVITENINFTNADITSIDSVVIQMAATDTKNKNSNISVDNIKVANYSAILGESKPKYEVIFYDEDGTTELYRTTVEEGQTAVYGGTAPTKAATAQYNYTFKGWDKELTNITAPTTFKAVYTQKVNKYTVTFVDYNGTTLGTSTVDYGTAATAPANPTRESDGSFTYTFKGWDKAFNNVTDNMTVTAQYDSTPVATEPEYIVFACYGDFNGDGKITASDIGFLKNKINGNIKEDANGYTIGEVLPNTDFVYGDFNGDGKITASDIGFLKNKINGNTKADANGYTIGEEAKIPITQ